MSEKSTKSSRKILIAVIVLAVAAAVLLLAWRALSPKGAAGEKTIVVQVVHGDGGTRDFTLNTAEVYLGGALVEGGVVENDQGQYGLYIQTADGETADGAKQQWWKVTRDGEMVNTGADSTPIADGEHYELTLTEGYDEAV